MRTPHHVQVQQAQSALESLITNACPEASGTQIEWLTPIVSEPWEFRTKAKMAVTGSAHTPLLTFPGSKGTLDLSDCPLYPAIITEVLASVKRLIQRAQVPPYRLDKRKGEIKYVLVTASESEALVRLVLRSELALTRIREHMGVLDPRVVSLSANIHPVHSALLEGDQEIPLLGADRLRMEAGDVTLGVLPRSFTQTNTAVAGELYQQVAAWIIESGARSVWDLYCGVGGFALNIAAQMEAKQKLLAQTNRGAPPELAPPIEQRAQCPHPPETGDPAARTRQQGHSHYEVHGVEVTAAAVESASETARTMGLRHTTAMFSAADATTWAIEHSPTKLPDAIVVNPPRRGIGSTLATWLNNAGPRTLVYSSCNPATLARDLALMGHYRVTQGRLVDMFPHTTHNEAVVLLERKTSP